MKITSIRFVRPFIGKRRVVVALSTGNSYKIKLAGDAVMVIPACQEGERDALKAVYQAVWEFLHDGGGKALDRGAKVACGRLVSLLDWPENFIQDTQARLNYVVNKITFAEDIF